MDRSEWNAWVALFVESPTEVRQRVAKNPSLLDARGLWGESPLMYLAVEGCTNAVLLALELGADPNTCDAYGCSVLQQCTSISKSGHDLSLILEALLKAGADPYYASSTTRCAWHIAQSNRSKGVQRAFQNVPPPVDPHRKCSDLNFEEIAWSEDDSD